MPPDELPSDAKPVLLCRGERVVVNYFGREPKTCGVRESSGPVKAETLVVFCKVDGIPATVPPFVPHIVRISEALLPVHGLNWLFGAVRVELVVRAGPQHRRPDGVIPGLQERVDECLFCLHSGESVRAVVC